MTTRSDFSGTETDRTSVVVVVERKPVSEEALKWALEAGEITAEMLVILVHVRPHITSRPGKFMGVSTTVAISDPPSEADAQYIKQVDAECDRLLERFRDFCRAKNVASRKVLMSSGNRGRCVTTQAEEEHAVRVYLGKQADEEKGARGYLGRVGRGQDTADYCVTNLSQHCTIVQFYSPTKVQRMLGQRPGRLFPGPPGQTSPVGPSPQGSEGDITVELLRLRGQVERLETELTRELLERDELNNELQAARRDADELRGLLQGPQGNAELAMERKRRQNAEKMLEDKKKEVQKAEESFKELEVDFDQTLASTKLEHARTMQEKQDLQEKLQAAEAVPGELQQKFAEEKVKLEADMEERRVRDLAALQSTLFNKYEEQQRVREQVLAGQFETTKAVLQQEVEAAQKEKEEQRTSFQSLQVQLAADLEQRQAALQDLARQLSAEHTRVLQMEQERDALSAELDMLRVQAQDATEQLQAAERYEAGQARLLEQALAELDRLRRETVRFAEYTWDELSAATEQFSPERRVGEGGFGAVFRGRLHHTDVAIKRLNGESMQGQVEFERELDVLSRMRHPHLLILLGACPDHHTLVYEFMHGGSLEGRLRGEGQRRLRWYERLRILTEVGTGLLFLHSARPQVVHRDLKPANILLDARGISKIGDAGLAICMKDQFATVVTSNPVGTPLYIDPEFMSRGEYSAQSDTYALGIIMLEMLTGLPPPACMRAADRALADGAGRPPQLDPHAGAWPPESALALARLGLECAQIERRRRPDLETNVLPRLQELQARAETVARQESAAGRDSNTAPYVFICPITQAMMEDPVIAYDGFCYERTAIEPWLRARGRSPMTNLPVTNLELISNFALRSAIREWLARHGEPNDA